MSQDFFSGISVEVFRHKKEVRYEELLRNIDENMHTSDSSREFWINCKKVAGRFDLGGPASEPRAKRCCQRLECHVMSE